MKALNQSIKSLAIQAAVSPELTTEQIVNRVKLLRESFIIDSEEAKEIINFVSVDKT